MAKEEVNSDAGTDIPGPPSANRGGDKYQRILDAAVAVFAEKGFFTSRVSDIADRADVADGTVYLYFKSKEEILMTAINTAFDAFMSLARMELRVLFEELARRVPVLRSLGPAAPLRSNIVAGIKHLPVDLSASPVRAS